MFYFEDEPHDDGTFVHEAVQSLVGEVVDVAMPSPFKARGMETVRMEIAQAYPAFFIGRRVSGHKRGLVRKRPLCRYLERNLYIRPDLHRGAPN